MIVTEQSWELVVGEDVIFLLNNLHPYPEILKSQYKTSKNPWACTAAPSCQMSQSSFSSYSSCCPLIMDCFYQTLYYFSDLSWDGLTKNLKKKIEKLLCTSLCLICLTVSIKTIIGKVFVGIISNIDLDIILPWEALLSVHIKGYQSSNNKHKKLLGKKFFFL